MARTIATALSMPLAERRMRREAMMARLRASTIQQWFAGFVDTLRETRVHRRAAEPPIAATPAPWPLRSANSGARYH